VLSRVAAVEVVLHVPLSLLDLILHRVTGAGHSRAAFGRLRRGVVFVAREGDGRCGSGGSSCVEGCEGRGGERRGDVATRSERHSSAVLRHSDAETRCARDGLSAGSGLVLSVTASEARGGRGERGGRDGDGEERLEAGVRRARASCSVAPRGQVGGREPVVRVVGVHGVTGELAEGAARHGASTASSAGSGWSESWAPGRPNSEAGRLEPRVLRLTPPQWRSPLMM